MIRHCFVTVTVAALVGAPLGLGFLWIALSLWDGHSLDGVF